MNKVKRFFLGEQSRTKKEIIVLSIVSVIFLIYAFSLVYPFFWAALTSLKKQREFVNNVYGFPKELVFDNLKLALQTKLNGNTTLIGMFINSIWSSFLSAGCGILFSSMTAYVVTKYKFKGSKTILAIAIVIQTLPLVGTMPAMFDLVKKLKMYNNPFLFWIVWSGGFGYSFIVLCGYFKGLSWEYAEAGFIDGASHSAVFFRIMFPLAFPAIFALFLVSFINAWNDYYTMYLYLDNYPTLAVGIYMWEQLSSQKGGTSVYMSALVISVIPVIIMYALFQKIILNASLGGGIKE